ncbi:hypothetical protein [Bradyrhizobium sp. DASA03007]|uniref:hypothetical protein n=1 Tax=unclassified Bradyrhizobium TaxID=2631580 RepID=UPI003F71AA94
MPRIALKLPQATENAAQHETAPRTEPIRAQDSELSGKRLAIPAGLIEFNHPNSLPPRLGSFPAIAFHREI